jgi:hypothetical protein
MQRPNAEAIVWGQHAMRYVVRKMPDNPVVLTDPDCIRRFEPGIEMVDPMIHQSRDPPQRIEQILFPHMHIGQSNIPLPGLSQIGLVAILWQSQNPLIHVR